MVPSQDSNPRPVESQVRCPANSATASLAVTNAYCDAYRGLTDESEILKFLQHGTLVGLLPVPHPILIRKYQANSGTTMWFRTYMWGVIYLR